ncbi:MAG: DEAD/DEAH box helicase [Spirochaetota bacterium]
MQFTELNLNADLMRGIEDLGFQRCTDVQADTLTRTLQDRDVAVQSQTGTGKTAAFLITIFQLMNASDKYRGTRALIVAPTRELAVQIENDAKALGKYLPQRTTCIYGGVGYGPQERALADKVEIVIGTPGRLLDFNQSGKLDFREMGILVIDEADRLFDMGFYPDIRKLMRRARPRQERLTMLYSATLSVSVRNISWQFMNDPAEIEIEPEHMTVDTVEQELYHVAKDEKFPLLLGLLARENPKNALIFCNTKRATEIVAKKLQLNGYETEFMMGDLPQKKRLMIIERIKSGDIRVVTATDVAARGLHVDDLDLVVNYDLPEDPEAYVHRIGRTARAGREGKAISLACERFVYSLESIEELIGMRIPTSPVTDALLLDDASAGRRLPSTHFDERPPRKRSSDRGASRSGRSRSNERPSAPRGGTRNPHAPKHAAADAGTDRAAKKTHHPPKSGRSGDRPRRSSAPVAASRTATGPAEKAPSRESSLNERLEYYKRKYGEDFEPAAGADREQPGTKSHSRGGDANGHRAAETRSDADTGRSHRSDEGDVRPQRDEDASAPETRKPGLLGRILGRRKRKR